MKNPSIGHRILILGCQIGKDGSLTKLLQGRTDRAIEFAKMQKNRLGRPIVFVPSGGKGSDEIISEGEAIKRYLIEQGIDAFWNFTNVELTDPNSDVLVENMHFSDSLLALSYFVSDKADEELARQNRQKRLNNRT